MKRQLVVALIAIAALLFQSRLLPRGSAQQTANSGQITKSEQLAGLRDRVTVRRDERGIPYIEASNDEDLYFAQGFVTASDRLWQMDLLRRTVRGELSEIFGQATLSQDKNHRIYDFAAVIEGTL